MQQRKLSHFIFTLVFLGAISLFSGCAKSPSQKDVAVTPSTECLTHQNCSYPNYNSGFYSYSRNNNGYYSGFNSSYKNGFCGCGPGKSVAYNGQLGLVCVNHTSLPSGASYISYNWNHQYYSFSRPQPVAYSAIPTQYQGSCSQSVLNACLVLDSNSCGPNGYCRAIGGGALGVCLYR